MSARLPPVGPPAAPARLRGSGFSTPVARTLAPPRLRRRLVFLLASIVSATSCGRAPGPAARGIAISGVELREGDLVFRRTRTLEGRMVSAVDRAAPFTHVGVAARTAAGVMVVHAAPGADAAERLKVEPLAVFAAEADTLAVRRLASSAAVARLAARAALAYAADPAVVFDRDFRLESERELYCTELVWRAYRRAGLDLVDGRAARVAFVLGPPRGVLLPSALLGSPYLVEVRIPPTPPTRGGPP